METLMPNPASDALSVASASLARYRRAPAPVETLNAFSVPVPTFELAYNGKAITQDIAPFVLSIGYTDHLSGESDELEVELEDTDGRWLAAWYPEKGATLTLSFGYLGKPLISAGAFNLDEIELSGPPSTVRLRALATGVKKDVRTRQARAYENTTLAAIARRIAGRQGMTLIGAIEDLPIDRATQYHETDLAFLKRVAASYGYALKVTENNTRLVFWKTADLALQPPKRVFRPADLSSWHATDKISDMPEKARVKYHDPKNKKLVAYDVKDGEIVPAKASANADTLKLTRRAPTKQAAQSMAMAELDKRRLASVSAEIELPGDASLAAGIVVELADLGALSGPYVVHQAMHRIERDVGFTTSLELKRGAAKAKGGKGTKELKVYGMKDGKVEVVGTTSTKK